MTQQIVFQDGQAVVPGAPCDDCTSYAGPNLVKTIFGSFNVNRWADVDNIGNSGSPWSNGFSNGFGPGGMIDGRIAWALCLATSTIDSKLSGGPYAVPFVAP